MKKLLLSFVLVGGIAAVTFASLNTAKKSTRVEKKMEKKEMKKECCKHSCPFS